MLRLDTVGGYSRDSGRPYEGDIMHVQDFIHDLRYSDLPAPVRVMARRCLLDLIGVAASGRRTDLARIVTNHAARQFGAGEGRGARMIFDGRRVSPVGAAYAGASLIDSFDAHDGHALTKGHAGVAILPALLAFWEAEDLALDDQDVLTSIVIGYEIATRAGIALHASACDYHTSGAWNSLACAAIGARLMKLSPAQTREALGTAEYHGPRSQMMRCIDYPTMLKDGSGWGALVGVSAAYLAADGFTGAPALTLEAPEQQVLWGDLGSRWYILDQYFKPYPVCRWAQPAVQAARDLMSQHGLTGADIADVEVRTFAEAVRLHSARPATTEEAQYSLPFPLAAMILRGRIGADEITGAGLRDTEVLDLSSSIRLVEDPQICARFPAERFAVVSLGTRDGRRFTSEWTKAYGGPENPQSDAEISAKYRALAGQLGDNRRQAIETMIAGMGAGAPAADLADLVLEPIGDAA
ncbi:MmgE/PrpD family protein [Ancylobacter sp. A5.8]|uniref:MmgE/PrpD family protein n=1 Tax=Ancylobacter gelatini TaxID=2919920 RepID=UPI001F4D8357|nr:MmgE/PrpD family protein [Ancylobacter gelatini]MCJ8143314.1 MmgE/PrpD family protein [Ancylobacter gelatini]